MFSGFSVVFGVITGVHSMSESSPIDSVCVVATHSGKYPDLLLSIWDYTVALALTDMPAAEIWSRVEAEYGEEQLKELLDWLHK